MQLANAAKSIARKLRGLPRVWDGRSAIEEMRAAGFRHWKQMEWMGFYFEFLCQKHLADVMDLPGPRYGKAAFDAFNVVPWDFKAHASNTSSHQIIVNDREAIERGIREYGAVGVVLAMGPVTYNDDARTFQGWHERLKGGKSRYERDRIARGAWSRLRKVSVALEQVSLLKITRGSLGRAGSFQTDFRNADGRPRRAKVLLNLERLEDELIRTVDFRTRR